MIRKRQGSQDEEMTYWLSYSDMMAALLLIFVLIISFTMLQAKSQYEEKEAELTVLQEDAEAQRKEAEAQREEAERQRKEAEDLRKKAEEQQKELESQRAMLEQQQGVLDYQQEQLDRIIGVRSDLILALKEEFEGTDLKVSVDEQTGAITLDSSILFDTNRYDLKDSGRQFLENFLPRYLRVLLKEDFREYMSEIIIEGHTDTRGTYMHNLELSQDRALSVAKFCLEDGNQILSDEELAALRTMVTANGRSFSAPIYKDGTVDLDASRRVEFKFRLKDEEMIEEMMGILAGKN